MALVGLALSTSAAMGDALVGRDSSAKINARVIELVNDAREAGAPGAGGSGIRRRHALRTVPQLTEAASRHARDMARKTTSSTAGATAASRKTACCAPAIYRG